MGFRPISPPGTPYVAGSYGKKEKGKGRNPRGSFFSGATRPIYSRKEEQLAEDLRQGAAPFGIDALWSGMRYRSILAQGAFHRRLGCPWVRRGNSPRWQRGAVARATVTRACALRLRGPAFAMALSKHELPVCLRADQCVARFAEAGGVVVRVPLDQIGALWLNRRGGCP